MGIFIGGIINILAAMYGYYKILNVKPTIKTRYLILIICIESLLMNILFLVPVDDVQLIKMFSNLAILCVVNKYIFKMEFHKILFTTLFVFILLYFSEMVWAFILLVFFSNDLTVIKDTQFIKIISNIIVSILFVGLMQFRYMVVKIRSIINIDMNTNNILNNGLPFVIILSLCIIIGSMYFDFHPLIGFLINLFLIGGYVLLIVVIYKEKYHSLVIKAKYDVIARNNKAYGEMLAKQRMINHENKNNLVSIKSMIHKNNKKASSFIDCILNDKNIDDKELIDETEDIPLDSVQGLVYQKLLAMKKKYINYELYVSREIKKFDFDNIDMEKNKHICTFLGILIDNAIEAVESLKDKNIGVFFYEESGKFCIEVTNTYGQKLDLQKMGKARYTTKGGGHGYGLYLISSIIKKKNDYENIRRVNGSAFSQIIKIKM